ncbi:MAG: CCA tRNA nucleotidyltransferase [Anaerolineales bacterium]|nr:MAG: CCA tRNA nucleotidyltransferase [Anaerolineales bacterium]
MTNKFLFTEKVNLPEWPIALIRKVSHTDSLWLVGGTVRDLLINRPLHDWDFVSSTSGIRLAKQVANAFNGAFYILDKKRETGRAIVQSPESTQRMTLDFAMLRDSTLTGDLLKRDFTVNAMAMSLTGEVLDPLHCQKDLGDCVIPMTTADCFRQDPVRLLRAIRQSKNLDFSIDPATYTAIRQQAHLINTISPERVLSELCTLLSYHNTTSGIEQLEETHILSYILPEINTVTLEPNGKQTGLSCSWINTVSALSMADHMLSRIDNIEQPDDPAAKGGALWHELAPHLVGLRLQLRDYFAESVNVDIHRSTLLKWALLMVTFPIEDLRHRLNELRMPNRSLDVIITLIETYPLFQQMSDDVTRSEIYRFYKQAGKVGPAVIFFALALTLIDAEIISDPPLLFRRSRILLQVFFEHGDEFITPVPILRGDDLIELGVQPGPVIGELLDRLLEAQVTGHVESRTSAVEFVLNQSIFDL